MNEAWIATGRLPLRGKQVTQKKVDGKNVLGKGVRLLDMLESNLTIRKRVWMVYETVCNNLKSVLLARMSPEITPTTVSSSTMGIAEIS